MYPLAHRSLYTKLYKRRDRRKIINNPGCDTVKATDGDCHLWRGGIISRIFCFEKRIMFAVVVSTTEIVAHIFKGRFFQTADLGLGDADFSSYFHLGFSLEETKLDDQVFPVIQLSHGII